jgi:two-component system response regulator HydG
MKRMLVVDDEPEPLDIFRAHFQGRYEVDTATSGAAAIEWFIRQRPDVVFLDINMPGANGVEVLKLFRQTDASIPIIMVTANTEIPVAEECIKQGAFSYVPKPFNLVYMDHMAALAAEQYRGGRRERGRRGRPARLTGRPAAGEATPRGWPPARCAAGARRR